MKQFKILIFILLLTGCSLVNNKEKEVHDIPKNDEEEKPKEEYIDNNPIKLGLFPLYPTISISWLFILYIKYVFS